MNWTFERMGPMGGWGNHNDILIGSGLSQADVLVREAVQNSVDAKKKVQKKSKASPVSPKVKVIFRLVELDSVEKKKFVNAMQLHTIASHKDLGDEKITANIAKVLDPTASLRLLYISDHDCVGLSGDPRDRASNFFRLLLTAGSSGKDSSDGPKGGSFGYGKAVYSSTSHIRTIVTYTRFMDGIGEKTRLFGCTYFPAHSHNHEEFTGRVWFGRSGIQNGQQVVDPIEDDAADVIAAQLGFEPRIVGDTGTSILVIDADPTITGVELQIGVEKWWWPRLMDQELDIEIHEQGSDVRYPKPKLNAELGHFINAYAVLIGDSLQNDTTKKYSYNKTLGRELGSCVVHALDNDLPPSEENLLNSVALMRGTSMVVQYMKISESLPLCVGVFKAADEIDDILRMSENPAHVHWDSNSTRLSSEEERSIVKTILKRTKENFKKFQKELAPSHSSKILAINEIANALASYLRPQIGSNKMPPGSPGAPIHISFLNQPSPPVVTKKGDLRIDCKFQVSIDEKCPYEKLKMYVRINSPIIEQGEASKDRLAFKMSVTDIEKPSEYCGDATDELIFILEKKKSVTIRAVSEDYDRDWEIRVEPELRGETI